MTYAAKCAWPFDFLFGLNELIVLEPDSCTFFHGYVAFVVWVRTSRLLGIFSFLFLFDYLLVITLFRFFLNLWWLFSLVIVASSCWSSIRLLVGLFIFITVHKYLLSVLLLAIFFGIGCIFIFIVVVRPIRPNRKLELIFRLLGLGLLLFFPLLLFSLDLGPFLGISGLPGFSSLAQDGLFGVSFLFLLGLLQRQKF